MANIQSLHLINFAKWTRCYHRIKDVFQYKAPDVSNDRQKKAGVAYLEGQLRGVSIDSTVNQCLEDRSIWLAEKEEAIRPRLLALQAVGMRLF
jgi:hypothetical protein